MIQPLQTVRPGDLITADLINVFIASLLDLDSRIKLLEAVGPGGTAVVITGLLPSGPVALQTELRIIGKNFGLPGSNVVTVDNSQITQFKAGSGDTQLIFDVPLLQGVVQGGKVVTLTVSNPQGFASTSLIVVPGVPTVPTGNLFVNLTQSPADPKLLAGQSYTFVFTLKAITNLEEIYTLSPRVQAGWPAIIVDQNNIAIAQEITLPKGDPPDGVSQDVRVRVSIPGSTPTGTATQLFLTVTSKRNPTQLSKPSGGDTITVGDSAPHPQLITVSFNTVLSPPPPTPTANVQAGVVVIPVINTQYRVDFSALIRDQGTYDITLTPPGGAWAAQIQGASSITTTSTNENRLITTSLSAQTGAGNSQLTVRVVKSNDPTVFGQFSQPIRLE
jgi:hypothetical protein